MNIYERLIQDHEKQRDLCARLEETHGDSKERNTLWKNLKIELEAHASAEEQTFYAALMEVPEASDQTRHSVSEHKEMADLVEELSEMDMSAGAWLTKFKELSHEVNHHLDEEEEDVFSLARKHFSDKEAEGLAKDFNTRKPAEVEKEKAA